MSASALWAKKAINELLWLPLPVHLSDTAEITKRLWRKWMPQSAISIIAESINSDEQAALKLAQFCAAAHDIGKATPVFQATLSRFQATDLDLEIHERLATAGFEVRESRDKYRSHEKSHHAVATQLLLENAVKLGIGDANLCTNTAVILGAHHGKPPDEGYGKVLGSHRDNFGEHDIWRSTQAELIKLALKYGGYNSLSDVPCPTMPGQILLSGLLIMADWIASDTKLFPLLSLDFPSQLDSVKRALWAWDQLKLPGAWQPERNYYDEILYNLRFNNITTLRAMQQDVVKAANIPLKPGIMVIEAPMGSGKTEAALVVAEIFRNNSASGGVFFALPTQATSDGIFPRLKEWMDKLDCGERYSINLAHGKAEFNAEYESLRLFESDTVITSDESDEDEKEEHTAMVHDWFNGRKKSLLADFVVGTVDQLLLMALRQKHVMLRHLGLAGKVVIIDECHAYDAYMSQYLKRALRWLGAYGVPVIILSATLPGEKRRELVGSYLGKEKNTGVWAHDLSYPLITFSDGDEVKNLRVAAEGSNSTVKIEYLATEDIAEKLANLLSDGGYAGVILDTVKRAQDVARLLRNRFGDDAVCLVHSRFIAPERISTEEMLRHVLGKDGKRGGSLIVVGTQVLEQSLDIDFDVMITDIAPLDLLLQRMGRLQRHPKHRRPEKLRQPLCFITGITEDGFESGIDSVYHPYLLLRTQELLSNQNGVITLPLDIAPLVNAAYDKDAPQTEEKSAWEKEILEKERKAEHFRIGIPMRKSNNNIISWLQNGIMKDASGQRGAATVRDSYDAVEVILIRRCIEGFTLLDGIKLPSGAIDDATAKLVARQTISLPRMFSNIATIDELENATAAQVPLWQKARLLTGSLFLILGEDNCGTLHGSKLSYSQKDGLYIE